MKPSTKTTPASDPGSEEADIKSNSVGDSGLFQHFVLFANRIKSVELLDKKLKEEISEQKEKAAAQESQIQQLLEESKNKDKLIEQLKAEVVAVKKDLTEKLVAEENAKRIEVSRVTAETLALKEVNDNLLAKLKQVEEERKSEISERDLKINKLNGSLEELNELKEKMKSVEEARMLDKEKFKLAQIQQKRNLEAESKSKDKVIEQLKTEMDVLQNDFSEKLTAERKEKRIEISRVKNENLELKDMNGNLIQKLQKLEEEMKNEILERDMEIRSLINSAQYRVHKEESSPKKTVKSVKNRIPSLARKIPTNGVHTEANASCTGQLSPGLEIRISAVNPPTSQESSGAASSKKRPLSSEPNTSSSPLCPTRSSKRRKPEQQMQIVDTPDDVVKVEQLDYVDNMGNNNIFRAVFEGKELSELKRIVEQGSDVGSRNTARESILHLAIHHKDPEVVRYLIGVGGDVNLKDNCGDQPIHKLGSVEHNFREKLMALCENGAGINTKNASGNTLLHLAASVGRRKEDVELIIGKGGDWQMKSHNGFSTLHWAAGGGNPEVIEYLIGLGADVSLKDESGGSPLLAIPFTEFDFKGSLDVLLNHGVDINELDEDGNTLLIWSTFNGRPLADIQYIVEKGGNWKLKSNKRQSVLHFAVQSGNVDAIKYFVSLGVSINSKDKAGTLALHYLVENDRNFEETLDVLLEYSPCINSVKGSGDNLLGLSAYHGREKQVLEYIVKKGGDWKKTNKKGQSILHLAAYGGNVDAIKYIIDLGGNVHKKDKKGYLPMHVLANGDQNFKECLDIFLHHGSNINSTCKGGRTLLDLAIMENREQEDLEYIISKGGTSKVRHGSIKQNTET